jgi:uncharacterized membrane protein
MENIMNKLMLTLLLCALSLNVYAGTQQDRMKTCNADASKKALMGDERKAFMKDCLSGKQEEVANSQQDKMKTCNADAAKKELKGDERKAFMKNCLSSKKEPELNSCLSGK